MEKMNEQNTQGDCLERRRSPPMGRHELDGPEDSQAQHQAIDHQSLLSSPRHSELSLISDSTGLKDSNNLGGNFAHHHTKEVKDPNFIQIRDYRQLPKDNAADNNQKAFWQNDIFAPSSETNQQMYQTQQQKATVDSDPLGKTFGGQVIADRLSQIMARQSYPQAPITDRQRESLQHRDSMEGARQGLQGAGNGGGSIVHRGAPYVPQNVQTFTGSVTNDRLSSVQFLLSQSDKDAGPLTSSQNNYINIADPYGDNQENVRLPLHLQWSLTQSGGPESQETESHATKQANILQSFHSPQSQDPATGGIKSEDYTSQFNSVTMQKLAAADSANKHHFSMRCGEQQHHPIIVGTSNTPMAAESTPSSSINLIPERQSDERQFKEQIVASQAIAPDYGRYGNILSSPSEIIDKSAMDHDTSMTQHGRKMQGNVQLAQLNALQITKVLSPEKIRMRSPENSDCPSSLRVKKSRSPNADAKSPDTNQMTLVDETRSSQYITTVNSPVVAENNVEEPEEKPVLQQQVKSCAKPPVRTRSQKETVASSKQKDSEQKEEQGYSGSDEDSDEDGVATISVRGGNLQTLTQSDLVNEGSAHKEGERDEDKEFQNMINQSRSEGAKSQEAGGITERAGTASANLPLPHEIFNDNRPSEFEQPILSAKIELPKQIFGQQYSDDGEASEFKLEALESQTKLRHANDEALPIDYGNLPIEVSNLLLKQASSFSKTQKIQKVDEELNEVDKNQKDSSDLLVKDQTITKEPERMPDARPLILTDQNLDFQSSRGYDDDSYEVDSNAADRQAEMRPEDLEKNAVPSYAQDSSSISIGQLKLESERLAQVSEQTKNEAIDAVGALRDFKTDTKQQSLQNASKGEEISYLISRQTSMEESDDQSASLMFSQTNGGDRMTLLSMGLTQEKSYPSGQPTTSRKQHTRVQQFAQTSEKKGPPIGHDHVPSAIFTSSHMNGDRQQSVSSFNNTTLREGTSSASRQSYFVNALGQRISSDVLLHPTDQSLVGNNGGGETNVQVMWPVQEFGGETMSTIPDETQILSNRQQIHLNEDTRNASLIEEEVMLGGHGNPLMKDRQISNQQMTRAVNKEVSAPGYPSTTKQSLTEVNFNSLDDSSTNHKLVNQQEISSSIINEMELAATRGNNNMGGIALRQMTMNDNQRENSEDHMSVKRNLNLMEAFKTTAQGMPEQIHMQHSDSYEQNSSQGERQQSRHQQCQDEQKISRSNKGHVLLNESNEVELVNSHRMPHFNEDLPVFKSHENMGRVQNASAQYSLEAQQNFYQRYKHLRSSSNNSRRDTNVQKTKANNHVKSNSLQFSQPNLVIEEDNNNRQIERTFHHGKIHHSKQLSAYRKVNLVRSDGGRSTPENEDDSYLLENENQANGQERQQPEYNEHHVTQEYFAEENPNHVTNNDCLEDYLTDDDIAVFKSQLNDIPADLASQPIKINLTTNVKLLQKRHESTFLMSIEEADPIRVLLGQSNSKTKTKKSRAMSLSTNEEDNTGTGIEDRLSPKFEKLMQLQTNPSRQEHLKSNNVQAKPMMQNLMIKTSDDNNEEGILSSPLISNPTTKSFLHRIATLKGFQERLEESDQMKITPASTTHQQQKLPVIIYSQEEAQSPTGIMSEDEASPQMTGGPRPQETVVAPRDCQTTTNQDARKKRPSLMSTLYRQTGFSGVANQTQDNIHGKQTKSQQRKQQKTKRKKSPQMTDHSHFSRAETTMMKTQQTGFSRANESVPRDLQQWLSSLSMSQYGPLLVDQGLDDLQSLILMMGQDRVLPLTHQILAEAGIESSGHRARILVNLELEAGAFEHNEEIIDLLQTSTMSKEQVMHQADILFFSKNNDQSPGGRQTFNNGRSTPDHENMRRYGAGMSPNCHSPLTEQISKGRSDRSPLRAPAPANKFAGNYFSLSNWLGKNNLLFLQPFFIRSGYECLRSLILQSFSQFNKLTDETLRSEIGIEKIGHRLRILSQLRQDALVLFQMELIYRQGKDAQKAPMTLSQDESLFVLPGRQQKHFKSVFNDNSRSGAGQINNDSLLQGQQPAQHTQSQQYFHQGGSSQTLNENLQAQHHHMSQQQPISKKRGPRNHSFSKATFSKMDHSESVPSSVPSSQLTSYRQYQQQVPSSSTNQARQQRLVQMHQQQQQQQQSVANHGTSAYSFIQDHVDSHMHPWRHSTYFDQSRPVASQASNYPVGQGSNSNQSQTGSHKMPFKHHVSAVNEKVGDSMIVSHSSDQRAQLLQEYQRQLRETLNKKQQIATTQAQQQSSGTGLYQSQAQQNAALQARNNRRAAMMQRDLDNDDKSCQIF